MNIPGQMGSNLRIFGEAAGIPYKELHPEQFFQSGMCDGAFLAREYTYDSSGLFS